MREQRYWVKSLGLYVSDRQHLLTGEWLSDAVINAAQVLLKKCYPEVRGLQMTALGFTLSYAVEDGEFVQILNTKNHWITKSNIGCPANSINVYNSIPYKMKP